MFIFRSPEERLRSEVSLQVGAILDTVTQRRQMGKEAPHRFNAGTPPHGVPREKYMDEVGERAAKAICLEGIASVVYSPGLSKQATDEMPAVTPTTRSNRRPDDAIVVFIEPPAHNL